RGGDHQCAAGGLRRGPGAAGDGGSHPGLCLAALAVSCPALRDRNREPTLSQQGRLDPIRPVDPALQHEFALYFDSEQPARALTPTAALPLHREIAALTSQPSPFVYTD